MSTMDVTAVLKKVEKKKKLKAKDEKVVASTDSPKKKVKKSTESGDKKKKKSKKKTDPTGGAVGSPGLNLFDALGLGIFSKINDGISQFTEELGEFYLPFVTHHSLGFATVSQLVPQICLNKLLFVSFSWFFEMICFMFHR